MGARRRHLVVIGSRCGTMGRGTGVVKTGAAAHLRDMGFHHSRVDACIAASAEFALPITGAKIAGTRK
jgi:hypothetical protein